MLLPLAMFPWSIFWASEMLWDEKNTKYVHGQICRQPQHPKGLLWSCYSYDLLKLASWAHDSPFHRTTSGTLGQQFMELLSAAFPSPGLGNVQPILPPTKTSRTFESSKFPSAKFNSNSRLSRWRRKSTWSWHLANSKEKLVMENGWARGQDRRFQLVFCCPMERCSNLSWRTAIHLKNHHVRLTKLHIPYFSNGYLVDDDYSYSLIQHMLISDSLLSISMFEPSCPGKFTGVRHVPPEHDDTGLGMQMMNQNWWYFLTLVVIVETKIWDICLQPAI